MAPSFSPARGNLLMALMGTDMNRSGNATAFAPRFAAHDMVFSGVGSAWIPDRDRLQSAGMDPIFAGQTRRDGEESWLDVPLFPDPSLGLKEDGDLPNHSDITNADPTMDYIQAGWDLLGVGRIARFAPRGVSRP
jgi:hypothetical protein